MGDPSMESKSGHYPAGDLAEETGWRGRLALVLTHLWVLFLPIQMPLLGGGDRPLHLALSDLVLVVAIVLSFSALQVKLWVWSVWLFALPGVMILNLLIVGTFTRYSILNKSVGILVLLAAYLLITSVINTIEDVRSLVRTFVVGTAIINLVALVSHLVGVPVPMLGCQEDCLRFRGFLLDPNLYGSLLVVAWALAWSHTAKGRRFISAPVDLVIQLSLLFGIVLTVSRSAWFSLAIVLLVGLVLRRGFSFRGWGGWAGLALVAAGAIFVAGDAFTSVADLAGRTHSIESRWVLIDQGLEVFARSPILGMGLGRFPEEFGQIIHNTPLWIAAELGLVGIAVFTGFLVWFLARGVRLYRYGGTGLRGIAIGLLLGNLAMLAFSLSVEALYQRHWWFLFAMTAVAHGTMEGGVEEKPPRVSFLPA